MIYFEMAPTEITFYRQISKIFNKLIILLITFAISLDKINPRTRINFINVAFIFQTISAKQNKRSIEDKSIFKKKEILVSFLPYLKHSNLHQFTTLCKFSRVEFSTVIKSELFFHLLINFVEQTEFKRFPMDWCKKEFGKLQML